MNTHSLNHQRGVSLLIVLLLLLIMTLLGLAGLRSTIMEEKMSGNLLDRSIGFQAAEAALREGEAAAAADAALATPTYLLNVPTGAIPATSALGGLSTNLTYTIVLLGPAPNWPGCDREIPQQPNCFSPRYRITATSAPAGRAQVVLQSNFAAP